MFFRTKLVKGTKLVQLVEPFCNAKDLPRQRVIASIGDATPQEHEKNLFGLPRRTVLYGRHNPHFEGACGGNPKAPPRQK